MSEHTKGPWRVGKGQTVVCDTDPTDGKKSTGHADPGAIEYYGGCLIAESIWKPEDRCLIAAAPDLLAACEEMFNTVVYRYAERDGRSWAFKFHGKLRAAITKAKGERP